MFKEDAGAGRIQNKRFDRKELIARLQVFIWKIRQGSFHE